MNTTVIFRQYKNGEVIALFPYEFWTDNLVSSYMHVGQHGGADYTEVIRTTKPAKQADFKPLYDELVSLGYTLTVDKKLSRKKAEFSIIFN